MANRLKMADIQAIQQLHSAGLSQREIARRLNVDRGSVSNVLQSLRAAPKPANAPTGSEGSKPATLGVLPGLDCFGDEILGESASGTEAEATSKPANAPTGSDLGICVTTATTGPAEAGPGTPALPGRPSACEPFRAVILAKLQANLSAQRIYQDLVVEQQYAGSYYSIRRFVQHLSAKVGLPMRRMECAPGFEAQVDYGTGASVITTEVLYRSIFDVVRDFLQDEAFSGQEKILTRYLKPGLLIVGDMGMKHPPKQSREYLFEIIVRRYETRSTIMTSNRPLEDWGKLIGDVPSATAILDRFLHHAEMIPITGRSDRLQNPGLAPDPSEKTATKTPPEEPTKESPRTATSEGDKASKPANALTGSKRPNDNKKPHNPQN